jgi:hypothetical protein
MFQKTELLITKFSKDSKALSAYLMNCHQMFQPKHGQKRDSAYWINAYNAYTAVKLIIDNYPTKSIKDISDPWVKKFISCW